MSVILAFFLILLFLIWTAIFFFWGMIVGINVNVENLRLFGWKVERETERDNA